MTASADAAAADAAVNALVANLVRACDEYDTLLGWGNLAPAIADRVRAELAKFPDQDRIRFLPALGEIANAKRTESKPAEPLQETHLTWAPHTMQIVVRRLLAAAPPLLTGAGTPVPGQAPAIECVVMFNNGQAVRGSLSETPEGALRLLSPGVEDGRPMLVEQFFGYEAISAVAIPRAVSAAPAEGSRIILPKGSVS